MHTQTLIIELNVGVFWVPGYISDTGLRDCTSCSSLIPLFYLLVELIHVPIQLWVWEGLDPDLNPPLRVWKWTLLKPHDPDFGLSIP